MLQRNWFRNALLFLTLGLLFQTAINTSSAAGDSVAGQDSRRNVARFLAKARSGKMVSIAFLGGSVSAGAGISDPSKSSYRALVMQWLKQRYGQTRVVEVNAAVAGTGSTYGAMRARRDCIAQKPDLVIVEFAADDSGEKEDVIRRSLEGIVRQLLTVPQPPELLFLYAPLPGRTVPVDTGDIVANFYRIPSVRVDTPASMWKENVGLNEDGARSVAKAVIERFEDDERQTPLTPVKVLAPPAFSDELTYGELIPFAQLKRDAAWKNDAVNDRSLPSMLLTSDKLGSQIDTFFEGTVVGIAFRAGPDGGQFECLIDGKPAPAPLDRVDTYDPVNRISTRIIAGGLGGGEHRLTIRVTGERSPKSSSTHVKLGYLIVGGQRPERL